MTKLVTDYTDLVTGFHKHRPNYMAMLTATLQPLVDANNFINAIPSYFDLDSAIGVQLDVVGQWVNISRQVDVAIPNPWFSWNDAQRGWGKGLWFQPYDTGFIVYNLNDNTYREVIRARIKANNWDGSKSQIYSIFQEVFTALGETTQLIVDDKQALQVIFALTKRIPSAITLEIFKGQYLPLTPAGVKTYYFVTSIQNTPIFGWGLSNSSVAGWGAGTWGATPDYLIQNPPDVTRYGHQLDFSKNANSCLLPLLGV